MKLILCVWTSKTGKAQSRMFYVEHELIKFAKFTSDMSKRNKTFNVSFLDC